MEPFMLERKQYFQLKEWGNLRRSLLAGITSRNGGVSSGAYDNLNFGLHVDDFSDSVLKNREIFANLIGFPLENWVLGEQIHGASVQLVTAQDKGKGAKALSTSLSGIDGLVTKDKGILLTAVFADCLPLYFFDPKIEMVGIAHAGWQGTVKGIAAEMVRVFEENGSSKENILVAIGPGISQEFYEVDDRVASKVPNRYQKHVLSPQQKAHYLFDLKRLNREILLHYGIASHNIRTTTYCTFRDKEQFYSHRRDKGNTGRMLGFIGFK
jgi:hypothetical protein